MENQNSGAKKLYEVVETEDHWFELRSCRNGKVIIRTTQGLWGIGHSLMHWFVTAERE